MKENDHLKYGAECYTKYNFIFLIYLFICAMKFSYIHLLFYKLLCYIIDNEFVYFKWKYK